MLPFVAPLLAQLALGAPPTATAVRAATPPSIDGRLDDEAWKGAAPITAFTQKFPDEGAAPSDRTTLRILYDEDAIYFAFDCEQTHSPVVQRLTRRDRQVESDWVSVDLGTRRDGKSAFELVVNAAGVQVDSILFNDTDSSGDWDENWEARATRTPNGWSAEIKVPFRILRFAALPTQTWDFQARRYVSERHETDEWSYIPRSAAGEVSHYGTLEGITGVRPGTPLELRPFVTGRARRRDAADTQLANGTDWAASAGLDLKWHPTQSLTLDATFNPDFAQVEADQVVLNLTTYETFYPEKRPFFLEGIDTFTTPRQLLYTRRIGRAAPSPSLRSDAPYNELLVDVPAPATIYGASKITGKLADRWTVGTLQAVTARNDVQVQLADGSRVKRLIDPLTSFNVLRVKRELEGNGYVGAMLTATTHAEPTGNYPLLAPDAAYRATTELCPNETERTPLQSTPLRLAPNARCFNDAYVGAIDWRYRTAAGDWVTGGQATGSVLQRGPDRRVPDGTVLRPGDVGSGLFVYVNKEGGKHWVGDLTGEYEGRKLDYTDLGYNQRSNDYRWRLDLQYRELERWWWFREAHTQFEYAGRRTIDGLDLGSLYQLNVSGQLANFWTFFTEVHYRTSYFDDREMGDGAALQRAGLFGYELELASDPTKRVSFTMETQTQALANGFNFNGDAGVLVRALPQLDVEVLPTAVYTFGEPRFAEDGAAPGQYVFGKLTAKSLGATLRTTYTFAPRLTLQVYGQLFLASGHYDEFTSFQGSPNGPKPVVHLGDLRPFAGALAQNPDFQQGVLNANVVLRWEYTLGSTLFFVYTRSQAPNVVLQQGDVASLSASSVSRAPAADVFLVKLTYWWGGA